MAARLRLARPEAEKQTTRTRRPKSPDRVYQLSGHVTCALCQKRMQGQVNHGAIRYRCRHRDSYAASASHPKNVYLNEVDLLPGLDSWMADIFAGDRIDETISTILAALDHDDPLQRQRDQARATKRKAERDLQGLLDVARAGGSAAALADAINETQGKLDAATEALAACKPSRKPLDREAVEAVIRSIGGAFMGAATPEERKQMFSEIGLSLRYDPTDRMVYGECAPYLPSSYVRVGGGTCTLTPRAFRPSEYSVAA